MEDRLASLLHNLLFAAELAADLEPELGEVLGAERPLSTA